MTYRILSDVPWKRLWLPLDTQAKDIFSGSGFLESWEIFGFTATNEPKELTELIDLRCLVLCGEPGMGKSTALELHRGEIEAKAKQRGELYWRSFREAISPEHLLHDLKSSPKWQKWIDGSEFTIVIDGIDEGLVLSSNLISVLKSELREKPVERLRLVLVCRDAEWPIQEGRALMQLWPDREVGCFQLQRLRYSDAEFAARHWGLSESEASKFMSEVERTGTEAFSARPMTLKTMVEEFRLNGQFPGTRIEIFRRACLRLCREDRERARFLKKSRPYEFRAEELFEVSKKIAGVMLLGRFSAVCNAPSDRNHLDLECLVPVGADERERSKVEAALSCALFSAAGNQARSFAQQSYAEYLASEYLANFPLTQVLDLICASSDQKPVIPQLHEVAAWLALRHEEFADWLVSKEPEILLRNDASSFEESQKSRFVAGYLERMAQEETFKFWESQRFFHSFLHSGLAEQVRPYLVNKNVSYFARRAAIYFVELGKIQELFEELLAIAKDVTAESGLRESAMNVVCKLITPERLGDLEPFARYEVGPDPDDELRGAALKALVPRRWKVSAALSCFTKPSNENFIGQFRTCGEYLSKQIEVADLPALLKELTQIEHPFYGEGPLCAIAIRTFILASLHLDQLEIATEFVTFIRAKLRQQELPDRITEDAWKEQIENSPSKRRQFTELFVAAEGMTSEEIRGLKYHGLIPLKLDDCSWFLERLNASSSRHLWARLARKFWPAIMETECRDDFLDACQKFAELGADIDWPCITLLESEQATHCRQILKWEKQDRNRAKSAAAKPTCQELFDAALSAALSDWKKWRKLAWELQRDKDSDQIYAANLDFTTKHRWQVCTDAEREQICLCARKFLIDADTAKVPSGFDAPLQVFWALWSMKNRFATDEELRAAVLSKWFEALFSRPFTASQEEQILTGVGVGLDSARAADCLRKRLMLTVSGQLDVNNVLSAFQPTWRSDFTEALMDFLEKEKLVGTPLSSAIRFLADCDRALAQRWLAEQLQLNAPKDAPTTVALALALFPDEFWELAKSKLETDSLLSESSFQSLANMFSCSNAFLDKLSEVHLADLYISLERVFPSNQPIKVVEDEISPRERIEHLRAFIPKRLEALASAKACQQLVRLSQSIPHRRRVLRRHLQDARMAMLRNAWSGVPVDVLAAIAAKRESRWVRSEDDLQELVLDSISRFQRELNRTEYPTARRLWNESPKLCPKEESALTEELARWLRDDLGPKNGIALACQVEPTLVHETDIEVWAQPVIRVPTGERFVITIEVKRSYNQEVATSLEKQLVAEYLLNLGRTHGIYVVGWYKGEGWKPDRNPLRAGTFSEAKARLDESLATSQKAHSGLKIGAVCLDCEFPQAFRKRVG